MLHTITPNSQRERQIVAALGGDGWRIVERRSAVVCLDNGAGALIEKHGHIRWIRQTQIATEG